MIQKQRTSYNGKDPEIIYMGDLTKKKKKKSTPISSTCFPLREIRWVQEQKHVEKAGYTLKPSSQIRSNRQATKP